tara:strand:- start:8 stop:190 length:183 start_codon:yes stop_codon:yes gene_type:complete
MGEGRGEMFTSQRLVALRGVIEEEVAEAERDKEEAERSNPLCRSNCVEGEEERLMEPYTA